MDLIDNGHTIQITNDVEVHVEIDGRQYDLVQYHFHAPSEHTTDGRYSPIEAHLVHKSADGRLAVIGVLIEEGEHDPIWDPLISFLPSGPGRTRHIEDLELDPDELKPLDASFFRYEGSLTTPPCSEGVQWIVMAEHPQMSRRQLEALASYLHDNHRPVQPLGDRRLEFIAR
jgi:carbonic anhydrase